MGRLMALTGRRPVSSSTQSPSSPTQRKLSGRSLNSGISKASLASTPLTPPPARNSQSTFPPHSAPSTCHGTPAIFVSDAWSDDSSDDAQKRRGIVDRLCERLDKDGWNILRDSNVLRSGDLISGFMKRIGLADHVIVVLSDKYLRSPFCMTELHSIYQRSVGEKDDFLRRIIPLMLRDAGFGTPEKRVQYAKHWETRYLKLKSNLDYLSVEDFRLYQDMKRWHVDVGNMLSYISDVLVPHGFDEIVKDDFAGLRQMLQERR
jgi:internalin A